MKRYNDYTTDELANLTDAEIKELVELECAHQGIRIPMGDPGDVPKKPDVKKSTFFKIDVGSIFFTNRAQIERMLQVITSSDLYCTEGWDNNKRAKKCNPGDYYYPKIEVESITTEDEYKKHASEIILYEKTYKSWQERKKEFDNETKAYETVVNDIHIAINQAVACVETRDRYMAAFIKYRSMAGGNDAIATTFFINAYGEEAYESIKDRM